MGEGLMVDLKIGDRITYRRFAAQKYENEFSGEVLSLMLPIVKVKLRNKAGKETIKLVQAQSIQKMEDDSV